MLLENKNAVIYGGGGSVGGAVARAFAREGANVFLAGRTLATLDAVANDIATTGGKVETAQVDALEADSVQLHIDDVVKRAGSIDISFNAINLGHAQGAPLVDMSSDWFNLPIATAMKGQFITTTAAGRHMQRQKSGVILAITAQVARRPHTNMGGFAVACAAIEGICRQLAVELGPPGVRVICLRSSGSPDTPGVQAAMTLHAENAGITLAEWEGKIAEGTLLKRLPKLAEVANAAVLMASDYANTMTATVANLTCGEIID